MANQDVAQRIENIKKFARRQWPVAHMLIDDETLGRPIYVDTTRHNQIYVDTFIRNPKLRLMRATTANRFSALIWFIDYFEISTTKLYKKRGTHDNSAEMIAKYPELCRWGRLSTGNLNDIPAGDITIKLFSKDNLIAEFSDKNATRLADYFTTYEQRRQAIENVYRILPSPIANEILEYY